MTPLLRLLGALWGSYVQILVGLALGAIAMLVGGR